MKDRTHAEGELSWFRGKTGDGKKSSFASINAGKVFAK